MIIPKNETEDILRSITENCEALFNQTHRKAEETLKYNLNKPRKTFHFNPPIPNEGSWMVGLKNLEVNNSFFT